LSLAPISKNCRFQDTVAKREKHQFESSARLPALVQPADAVDTVTLEE
jgi:hypothetical protein